MFRRILSTLVWFLAAWELGSAIALVTGFNGELVAPALAFVAASLVGIDPLHVFHPRRVQVTVGQHLATATQGQAS